jgi:hypothetical protein
MRNHTDMKRPVQPELPAVSESGDSSDAREQAVAAREYALSVPREELCEELRRLARIVGRRRSGDADLALRDGVLWIAVAEGEVGVSATGNWPTRVRLSFGPLLRLTKVLPDLDPVPIVIGEGRLRIDRFSMDCEVLEGALPQICLPAAPSLADRLRLRHQYTDEEIQRSGLAKFVEDAEAERDDLLQKAMSHLRRLDVKPAALRRFVQECIVEVHSK